MQIDRAAVHGESHIADFRIVFREIGHVNADRFPDVSRLRKRRSSLARLTGIIGQSGRRW
jgi:hypothetical protein